MDDESLVMNGQINFFDWPLMKKSCQEHFKLATKTEIHFVTCWHHVVVDTDVIQYSVLVKKFKIFIESIDWRLFWIFLEKTVWWWTGKLENEEWPQKLELHVLEKGATVWIPISTTSFKTKDFSESSWIYWELHKGK